MTTVHLHGHLGRQFGRRFRFAADTPAQAMALLEANFPEWRGVMLSAQHPFQVTVGRADHRDERGLTKRLGRARTIHIVPMVGGSNNGPVKMLAGAVLIVAGTLGTLYGGQYGGAKWGPHLVNAGIGMFAGGASQWLARGPNTAQHNRDEEGRRASYAFNGVVNTMAQGGCVPVLYGRLRHGGYIVSAGVSVEDLEIAPPTGPGFKILTNLSYQVQRGGDVVNIELVASGGTSPYVWTTGPGCPSWVTVSGSTLTIDPTHATSDAQWDFEVLCQGADGLTVGGLFRLAVGTMGHITAGSGGSTGPTQHVPSESPDSLQSRAVARLLLLLGEGPVMGPVDGLKSVYLDGTPIQNADGTFNFKLLKDPEFRLGMPVQDPLASWSEIESEQTDGRELKASAPVVLTVGDADADSLRLNIGYPSLCKSLDNGDLVGSMASVNVSVRPSGAAGWILAQTVSAVGKATTRYQKSALLKLRDYGPGPWQVRLERSTPDSTSVSENNKTFLDSYTLIQEARLTYPNRYLLGLTLDASQFQGIPTVGVESKGRIVRVPSNYDPEARAYSDIWDGTWKLAWTDNPAWAFLDLLTHPRYGLGRYVSLEHVAASQLYQVARYCDGMVADGRGGLEPRFALNAYLQQAAEAYSVLQHLAAAFRGMSYWGSGSVQVAQDSPADPVMLFTESNVVDGMFSYQSTSRRGRHNAVSVGWNDPADAYKIKYEYVSDPQDVAVNGLRQVEEIALGCTSQGQAHRWGLWRLYVERDETEIVSFAAGLEGIGIRPGDLIQVQDQSRVSNRLGGRILASDGATHVLDSAPEVGSGNYRLWCVLPDGAVSAQPVLGIVESTVTTVPFQTAPGEMAQWILQDAGQPPKVYRVLSRREGANGSTYDITALIHDPAKYAAIESGWELPDRPGIPLPPPLGPASQLALSSREVVREDYVSNVLVASWLAGASASKYQVSWRVDGGNWTDATVTATFWELPDAAPGLYEVRVASLDRGGSAALAIGGAYTLVGSLRDDWITADEKPALLAERQAADAEYGRLTDLAGTLGLQAMDIAAAYSALTGHQGAIPGWSSGPDKVYLGPGGWRTWEAKWAGYRAAAQAMDQTITKALKDGLDIAAAAIAAQLSDDQVTPPEKRAFKSWLTKAQTERDGADGLQARADRLGITRTAYDAAWTAVTQALVTLPGWSVASGDWASYETTTSLGAGVGVALGAKVLSLDTATVELRGRLATEAERPEDPVRPALRWDIGGADEPEGWTVYGATSSAAPGADEGMARRYTKAAGAGVWADMACGGRLGRDLHVVQARVRLVSGTWDGRVAHPASGLSVSRPAPQVGVWTTLTWDLRPLGSAYSLQPVATLTLGLVTDGAVDVDWVCAGVFGTGSLADQDGTLDRAIRDLLAQGNVSVLQNLIVANLNNLIPNPDSEQDPAGLPLGSWGRVALEYPAAHAYRGTGARKVPAGQRVQVSPRLQCSDGDRWAAGAMARVEGTGAATLEVEAYDSAGASLGICGSAATTGTGTWQELRGKWAAPADALAVAVWLRGPSTGAAYFDRLEARQAAGAKVLVDGEIVANEFRTANHLVEDGITTRGVRLLSTGTAAEFGAEGIVLCGQPFSHRSVRVERVVNGRFYAPDVRPGACPGWHASWWSGTTLGLLRPSESATGGYLQPRQYDGPTLPPPPGMTSFDQGAAMLRSPSLSAGQTWDSVSSALGDTLTQILTLPDRPPAQIQQPVLRFKRHSNLQWMASGTARIEVRLRSCQYNIGVRIYDETYSVAALQDWTQVELPLETSYLVAGYTVPGYHGAGDYALEFRLSLSCTSAGASAVAEMGIADVSLVL